MRTPWGDLVGNLSDELGRRPPARAAWTGFVIVLVFIFVLLLGLHFGARAYAESAPRVIFDCQQFASFARRVVVMREIGAERDKMLIELRRELRPGLQLALMEREIKLIYAGKPTRAQAEHSAYKRCQGQLGDMRQDG